MNLLELQSGDTITITYDSFPHSEADVTGVDVGDAGLATAYAIAIVADGGAYSIVGTDATNSSTVTTLDGEGEWDVSDEDIELV